MERLKLFVGSVVIAGALAGLALIVARVHAESKVNIQMSNHEALRRGIRERCVIGTREEFDAAARLVVKYNAALAWRQQRNRDGALGDFITPDIWDSVDPIVSPTAEQCAKLVAEAKIRKCELLMRADWQALYHEEGCGDIIAILAH